MKVRPDDLACFGERGVLAEKSVSGVNRPGTALLGDGEQLLDIEITVRRGRGADAVRLFRQAHMERGPIGLAKDGHGPDVQLPTGPDDPHGNLSAIRDEDLVEHGGAARGASCGDDCANPVSWSPLQRGTRSGAGALRCTQSGMLPCFFRGLVSRFVARVRSAWTSFGRVSWGSMMSSM